MLLRSEPHLWILIYWYEIPGQAGDDIVGQAGDDLKGQAGDDLKGQAGDDMLLHAELVDAAVCVSLTWAEECRWPLRLVW